MISCLVFDAKLGGLKLYKSGFRIIRVANYEFAASCET